MKDGTNANPPNKRKPSTVPTETVTWKRSGKKTPSKVTSDTAIYGNEKQLMQHYYKEDQLDDAKAKKMFAKKMKDGARSIYKFAETVGKGTMNVIDYTAKNADKIQGVLSAMELLIPEAGEAEMAIEEGGKVEKRLMDFIRKTAKRGADGEDYYKEYVGSGKYQKLLKNHAENQQMNLLDVAPALSEMDDLD